MGDDLDANTKAAPTLGLAGRYVIRRELGRGMMGVVYEAEDTVLGRTVALKTIELAFGVGEEAYQDFEQRFFTEARVAAKLSHPGIVVCHDVGKDPASGKLFIVFEYLKGLTLADRIVADTIAWEDALAIVVKVARAIHHAHANGVIHRDLKPANVMLLDSGHVGLEGSGATAIKIMDFGVARLESLPVRLTRAGQSFGSPLYMSPEQVIGHAATARSDIFSLGSVLCTLLLGRGWFEAPSIPEILSRVVHDDAPAVSMLRPGLPNALDSVVARALAKRVEDRYATAAAMADDLEDVLAGRAPRHESAFPVPPAPAPGAVDHDPLLADLTAAAGVVPGGVHVDPADALASLLDEAPPQAAATPHLQSPATADQTLPVQAMAHESPLRMADRRPGGEPIPPQALAEQNLPAQATTEQPMPKAAAERTLSAQATTEQPMPPRAVAGQSAEPLATTENVSPPQTANARPRFLLKVGAAAAVGVLLIAGAFLLRGRQAPSESPADFRGQAPSESQADSLSPAPVASGTPDADREATATPAVIGRASATPDASAGARRAAAASRPPVVAPPMIGREPGASVPTASAAASTSLPARARMRLDVEHPLEDGRLIVWIDGVLVYETKLEASVSRKIVAIKLREGHVEKMLDVEPGRHEVRVEVSWDDQHRVGTQLADIAAGSTGLLEVRVARITKDLTLEWSRMADR